MRRALPAILAAALLLGGCGGGGDDTASTSSSRTQATSPSTPGSSQQSESPAARPGQGSSTEPKASHPHLHATIRIPPISSAPVEGSTKPAPGVKTTKGADNSVQEYGEEQSSEERTEAATALQAYLNARLEEDWAKVCSYLAQKATEQLEAFIQSPKGKQEGISGCPDAMAALAGEGTPSSHLREQSTITEVLSFRGGGGIPGDPAYLIYVGPPGKTLYSMPMYLEGGRWKVGLAVASELPV